MLGINKNLKLIKYWIVPPPFQIHMLNPNPIVIGILDSTFK